MGRPVAPHAVECKFLGANKQPVVRGGWSSWTACVCSSVCGKDGKKNGGGGGRFAASEVKRPPRLIQQPV